MGFTFEVGKPTYRTPSGMFAFYNNSRDGPEGFHVLVGGQDTFYLPDRTLSDLADPVIDTGRMADTLETLCGSEALHVLNQNHQTIKDLHIALLSLKLTLVEQELRDASIQLGDLAQ